MFKINANEVFFPFRYDIQYNIIEEIICNQSSHVRFNSRCQTHLRSFFCTALRILTAHKLTNHLAALVSLLLAFGSQIHKAGIPQSYSKFMVYITEMNINLRNTCLCGGNAFCLRVKLKKD